MRSGSPGDRNVRTQRRVRVKSEEGPPFGRLRLRQIGWSNKRQFGTNPPEKKAPREDPGGLVILRT
jgi:hypothetical protein